MMAPGTTVHTSLLSGSSYLFYRINCLTENIFPSNSSVRGNELRNFFFPYNKILGTTEYNRCEFDSKFNICVFISFYQTGLQNFYRSVLIVSTNYLLLHLYLRSLGIYWDFSMVQQPLVGKGLLIVDASRSYSDTPHTVRLLWTSDQPDTENSTWQHITLTTDRHPWSRRDSNSKS